MDREQALTLARFYLQGMYDATAWVRDDITKARQRVERELVYEAIPLAKKGGAISGEYLTGGMLKRCSMLQLRMAPAHSVIAD